MEIIGYKYLTEQESLDAVELCNDYYAIPSSPQNETKNWCYFEYSEYDEFWYIVYDESLEIVLGEPTTFFVNNTLPSGTTENNEFES
jgi:hypothetical protein